MLHFDSSYLIVTRGSRVSRAPPQHTLPAFLNLNGINFCSRKILVNVILPLKIHM